MTEYDDKLVIPSGTYPAGLRFIAVYGSLPGKFSDARPRSAWQWIVRLPDGRLGSMTHLVTLDKSPGSHVRRLAAALVGDATLLAGGTCPATAILLARSCLILAGRQQCGGGRDRPVVPNALLLPGNTEPVSVDGTCLWYPGCGINLPTKLPSWVANFAVVAETAAKKGKG